MGNQYMASCLRPFFLEVLPSAVARRYCQLIPCSGDKGFSPVADNVDNTLSGIRKRCMLNRIRLVTILMTVLGIFTLLQLISGSLLFSSLHHNQKIFVILNDLRQQQTALTSIWNLLLQTRINLIRSSTRMMLDDNPRQNGTISNLLKEAKSTLAQSATHHIAFKNITPLPGIFDESVRNYHFAQWQLGALAAVLVTNWLWCNLMTSYNLLSKK